MSEKDVHGFDDPGPRQAADRLSDLYEVARRLRRIGVQVTSVTPAALMVSFRDPRIKARGNLTIEPWFDGSPGWLWYADLSLPDGFDIGPLTHRRMVVCCPYPRQVIRAYQNRIWYERRPMRYKKRRRNG